MTITVPPSEFHLAPLRPVVADLYRDIHKGIRAELFAVTETAGSVDPSDPAERQAVAEHVRRVIDLLESHAEHEDTHVGPDLHRHLPDLAETIEADHASLEARLDDLRGRADDAVASTGDLVFRAQALYLDLAAFTSDYLAHQDLEERVVMPALEDAVGVERVIEINQAIVASIPPEEMVRSLALMLPAMNVDDRAELLGGMKAGAPAEVFAGVWDLAGSVLAARDVAALADRLGV